MQTDERSVKAAPHNAFMENRRKLTLTGVKDIDSFNEQGVIVLTDSGVLIVKGSDMHVDKLNIESGDVCVEGTIDSLTYTDLHDKRTGSIIKSLFK